MPPTVKQLRICARKSGEGQDDWTLCDRSASRKKKENGGKQ